MHNEFSKYSLSSKKCCTYTVFSLSKHFKLHKTHHHSDYYLVNTYRIPDMLYALRLIYMTRTSLRHGQEGPRPCILSIRESYITPVQNKTKQTVHLLVSFVPSMLDWTVNYIRAGTQHGHSTAFGLKHLLS